MEMGLGSDPDQIYPDGCKGMRMDGDCTVLGADG